MTYLYDHGSPTPCASGRVDIMGAPMPRRHFGGRLFNPITPADEMGLTLRINDGTFITDRITGLQELPPIRMASQGLAGDHGDYDSTAYFGGRVVTIEGTIHQTHQGGGVSDLDEAIDKLMRTWAVATLTGGLLVKFMKGGWSEPRRGTFRLADSIIIGQPPQGKTKIPWREFLLPIKAADPRLYGDTERRVAIFPGETKEATQGGTFDSPAILDFHGPFTTLRLTNPQTGLRTEINQPVPAGDYVRVLTDERTATRFSNAGTWYGNLGGDFFNIRNTSENLTVSGTGTGAGAHVSVIYRDAWI